MELLQLRYFQKVAELGNMDEFEIKSGANYCLHAHNFFKTFDFLNVGEPSRIYGQERDVRELGSGNAGATNVLRSAGVLPGVLTFGFDALKGFVACYMGKIIFRTFNYYRI